MVEANGKAYKYSLWEPHVRNKALVEAKGKRTIVMETKRGMRFIIDILQVLGLE